MKLIPKLGNWCISNPIDIGVYGIINGIANILTPDGIRFEIHEALDRLYTQGYRATRIVIAARYRELMAAYLERGSPWRDRSDSPLTKLYGLPVSFSPEAQDEPCWEVINFDLEKEPGVPVRYPYFRLFE